MPRRNRLVTAAAYAKVVTDSRTGAVPITCSMHHAATNGSTSRFAARLPGFGIITHAGRKTNRGYRTPVNVFQGPDGFLIALTYGRDSQWVRNVLAAGGCQLETRGARYQLCRPMIVHD